MRTKAEKRQEMIDAENMKFKLLPEEKEAPKTAQGEGEDKTFI